MSSEAFPDIDKTALVIENADLRVRVETLEESLKQHKELITWYSGYIQALKDQLAEGNKRAE